jgi:hypothetical protein
MSAAPTLLPVVEPGENRQRLEKRTFAIAVLKYCEVGSERRLLKKRPYAVDRGRVKTKTSIWRARKNHLYRDQAYYSRFGESVLRIYSEIFF